MINFKDFNRDTIVYNAKMVMNMVAENQVDSISMVNDIMDYYEGDDEEIITEEDAKKAIANTEGGVWSIMGAIQKKGLAGSADIDLGSAKSVATAYVEMVTTEVLNNAYEKAEIEFADFADTVKWVMEVENCMD